MTIGHPSKQGKLNGVDIIFPNLFYLNKYTLITTINFMIDDVKASQYFQTNGSKMIGVPYCLTLKLNSKHSIDYFLPNMQKTIIKHNEDWHDRVTYKTASGIFSFSLVYGKKLSSSPNIYLLSLLLDQFSPGQSFVMQSQIKDLLKMENKNSDQKEDLHVYTSDNLFSQINNLVSNREKVRKTKMEYAQKLWLDPYRDTWKTSLSISCS